MRAAVILASARAGDRRILRMFLFPLSRQQVVRQSGVNRRFETFLHEVALVSKEASYCRFSESV